MRPPSLFFLPGLCLYIEVMSFLFGSSLKEEEKIAPNGADMVERLVTRLNSSMMLDDRRASVASLKSLSKQYKVDVGTHAMNPLISVLKDDRADVEISNSALETLINVTTPETPEGEQPSDDDVGVMFTEIFVKSAENVILLLSLLEETDLYVRLNTVKLLTTLLNNRATHLQDAIMKEPVACAKLMELLHERREIIRNEGLLLLIGLTRGNQQMQKLVAFQNAFDEVMSIISQEGNSDGGIIVDDCIRLLMNLVEDNVSNQNFFRESSVFSRLVPFFRIEKRASWDDELVNTVVNMLALMRVFTSSKTPTNSRRQNQNAIVKTGLFLSLCDFTFTSTFPKRGELLHTVGSVMCGNSEIQKMFANYKIANKMPSLVALLNIAFQPSNPLVDRYATIFCYQCVTEGNPEMQQAIAHTLNPEGIPSDSQSVGLLLCQGILAKNITWEGACALTHVFLDNTEVKEKLLQVALQSTESAQQPLLTMCVGRLSAVKKDRRGRLGLLLLLVLWLHDCPFAVNIFLQTPDVVSFLVNMIHDNTTRGDAVLDGLVLCLFGVCVSSNDGTQAGADRDALMQYIKHIGTEDFLGRLERFSKCDDLTRAAQSDFDSSAPFTSAIASSLLAVVDVVKGAISGEVQSTTKKETKHTGNIAGVAYHDSVIAQYKDVIREQDARIDELSKQLQKQQGIGSVTSHNLQQENEKLRAYVEHLQSQLVSNSTASDKTEGSEKEDGEWLHERTLLEQQLATTQQANSALTLDLKSATDKLRECEKQFRDLKGQHEYLLVVLVDENNNKKKYQGLLRDNNIEFSDDDEDEDDDDDVLFEAINLPSSRLFSNFACASLYAFSKNRFASKALCLQPFSNNSFLSLQRNGFNFFKLRVSPLVLSPK
eukprot:m.127131 g.127131  ORF g.127131 m.127131 type:complete len:883 (+) comp9441_c1_seq3:160-2808(+)